MMTLLFAVTATAAASSNSADVNIISPILNVGLIGVILLMLIFEIGFVTKKSAERERDAIVKGHTGELRARDQQLDALREDLADLKKANDTLQEFARERMFPALVQATEVSRAYVSELAKRHGTI